MMKSIENKEIIAIDALKNEVTSKATSLFGVGKKTAITNSSMATIQEEAKLYESGE
jgi:hypothetical protein